MSGTALTMVSPSSVRMRRSTPWVDGCCGPMLMVMVSRRRWSSSGSLSSTANTRGSSSCIVVLYLMLWSGRLVVPRGAAARTSLTSRLVVRPRPRRTAGHGRLLGALWGAERLRADAGGQGLIEGDLAAPVRLRQADARERVVLAERVADPIGGHQDAREIRVTGEADAEEVVDLALIPVRRGPDRGDGGDLRVGRVLVADADLQPDGGAGGERHQVVDHVEAGLALRPVHRRDLREEVEALLVAQGAADRLDRLGPHDDGGLAAVLRDVEDVGAVALAQERHRARRQRVRRHERLHRLFHRLGRLSLSLCHSSAYPSLPRYVCPVTASGSGGRGTPLRILSCRRFRPWSSMSG